MRKFNNSDTLMKKAISILLLCVSAAILSAEVPSVLAIRNARVVTVSGPTLQKGTVVVRRGLIESVGENVAVPADAWILEGDGLTVYPGLIDGLSTWGITDETAIAPAAPADRTRRGGGPPAAAITPTIGPIAPPARGPEDRPATTSWLRAADLVKPTDRRLEAARSAGFTSAITFPTRGIFAGQGAAINLAGQKTGSMVVMAPVGQYVSLTTAGFTSFPGSLMGVISYIRQVYLDANYYRNAKEMYAKNPKGMTRPEYDRALEGVLESPRTLLPATRVVDINRMISFANELKVKPVLYGVHRGYAAADAIAKAVVPVLVSLKWPEKAKDADPEEIDPLQTLQLRDNAPSTPKALAAAKVKFGFYSDGIESPAEVLKAVKRAIDAGLPQDDAVRAFTLSNAEIFGLADRMGSIEKGKIANLVVTKGDLFADSTKVQYILIDGTKFEPVPETPPATPAASASPTEEVQ
jgi:imidazolonepropionase-like amidohydrolase